MRLINKKGNQMKYIRSHIVEAKPATLGEWEAETGKKWNEADRPRTDEGYKCDYPNGYSGWCPKAEFEKVSRPANGMTFGQAIDACRYRGAKIQRANWNGEWQFVRFENAMTRFTTTTTTAAQNAKHFAKSASRWSCRCCPAPSAA